MNHYYTDFVYAFVSIFSMVNPIGVSAIFQTMTQTYSLDKRRWVAVRVSIYGSLLTIGAFLIGPQVLKFFGISISSIQVAGGMVVFYTAWNMLNTRPKISNKEEQEALTHEDIAFFPLTMPITAGAGTIAVAITLASRFGKRADFDLIGYATTILAIIAVFLVVWICNRSADTIFRRLGVTGTNVVASLTAFILLAISVNLIWEGMQGLMLGAGLMH